jgi:hypothetical protein
LPVQESGGLTAAHPIQTNPQSDFNLRWTWVPENGIDTTTDA